MRLVLGLVLALLVAADAAPMLPTPVMRMRGGGKAFPKMPDSVSTCPLSTLAAATPATHYQAQRDNLKMVSHPGRPRAHSPCHNLRDGCTNVALAGVATRSGLYVPLTPRKRSSSGDAQVKPGVVTGSALKDLLQCAKDGGYAIPAVNCVTSSSVNQV
jgi:hypothetical protein